MTRDPYTTIVVRLPERDLAEVVLELTSPLLGRLGAAATLEEARAAIELTVAFWNVSVLASKRWDLPRVKELRELKKRLRGRGATREDARIRGSSRAGCTKRMLRACGASRV